MLYKVFNLKEKEKGKKKGKINVLYKGLIDQHLHGASGFLDT